MKKKFSLFILGLTVGLIPQINHAQTKINMKAVEENKAIVRKIYDESLNKRNFILLKDIIDDDYIGVKGLKGVAGLEAAVKPLIESFPDIQWKIEELVAEGNKVVVKWKWQGQSIEPYQQLDPVKKMISNEAIAIYELKNEKVIKAQLITDRLGFLQQMNALPTDLNLITNKKNSQNQIQFIDKFSMPITSKKAFIERMKINRDLIKILPGFIEDEAYERIDDKGNLIVITVAKWQSEEAIKNAKEKVQAEYKRLGFNMQEFLTQWQITMDRGMYKKSE